MDGTLFDHDGAVIRDLRLICSPEELREHNIVTGMNIHDLEKIPHFKARIDIIRKQYGWWRSLAKFQLGWEVLEIAQKYFTCQILTKGPKSKPHAWTEKVQCIHDHFGDNMSIDIVGQGKGGIYGRVLVDDYPVYIKQWLEHRKRGLVIMPAHSYNKDFNHPNVIRYDGWNQNQVERCLMAAANRGPKDHWIDYLPVI